MKKLKTKDKAKRSGFKKKELKTRILKSIAGNSNIVFTVRWKSLAYLVNIGRKNSKTGIVNHCIQTISKKAFNKKLRLSRLVFFREARKGVLEGFTKAVW